MNTTTSVKTDNENPKPATFNRTLRPVLLPHISSGRIGSPRPVSFGWARTSSRRFMR